MKDPKILLHRMVVLFDAICFLLALYWTLKNIGRFHEDTNATAITYKKYGETSQDKYPSFTLCFEGNDLYRFNESAIFSVYGIHLSDYEFMLDGKQAFQYDYDPSNQRYGKSSLSSTFKPNIRFKVQDLFQLPDIIESISFVASNQDRSIFFGTTNDITVGRVVDEPPLHVSYQSSKQFCLTRNESYTLDFIRRYDYLAIRPSYLNSNTRLKVFIHYPGQLLRSVDTPRLETLLSGVQDDKVSQTLSVSQTTLLRKRSIKNDPCNKNIVDHDRFLLESLSNDTGCIPPYWKNIIGILSNQRECSSPEQLKKIHDLTKDYKKVLEDRDTSCLTMFNSVVWSKEEPDDLRICKKCIYLKIVYLDRYYEEIIEIKDFGLDDFISGLGGFIGIFLGYSMMQIPRLFGR